MLVYKNIIRKQAMQLRFR